MVRGAAPQHYGLPLSLTPSRRPLASRGCTSSCRHHCTVFLEPTVCFLVITTANLLLQAVGGDVCLRPPPLGPLWLSHLIGRLQKPAGMSASWSLDFPTWKEEWRVQARDHQRRGKVTLCVISLHRGSI